MTGHLIETARGMTKRIILTKYKKFENITDDEVKLAIDFLPKNKQPMDSFRLNARCYIIVLADESTRNAALATIKKALSNIQSEIKAVAFLTKLQQENK
jgi:hypothetical protein